MLTVPGIGTGRHPAALTALIAPTGPLLQRQRRDGRGERALQAGSPAHPATRAVASLSVLGTKLSTDRAGRSQRSTLDSQSLDPSNIDISKVLAPTVDLSALQRALAAGSSTRCPTIAVPAVALHVKVTPGRAGRERRHG